MPAPPYQPLPFAPSPSLSPSLPSRSSQMRPMYPLASVPRVAADFREYDVYENFIGEPPQVESYEQNTQMDSTYAGDAANFHYQSDAHALETLGTWPVVYEASTHPQPLDNQLMRFQNTQWGNLPLSVSARPSPAGSNPAASNYSQNYPSPSESSRSVSYPSMQMSPDGRRSRSSEMSHHTNSCQLSPPQTPCVPQMTPVNGAPSNLDGHREQLRLFKDALILPLSFNAGPFVPQKMYMPHTNSDRRRYVEEIDLQQPIYFWMESPDECGISLIDALHSRVRRLRQRDEPVFEGRGPSISVRIQWPGYRPWSRQIPTKDFRSPPQPITKAKLAKNIAKCVERFLSDVKARTGTPLEDDVDPRWKVGPRNYEIKLEDLYLVSMHHVSMGSWQPHLRLRRPLPP
ncbi:hypothetical protein C0995_008521 [Termitomyces sp. Mi166|nr:hypothetical protein C0995_008521 [Termitomyces sp. Mi166\